jgi:cell division protein ZapA
MKQLDVQIMGQNYLLGCPEGGEAKLTQAVQRVDAAMCKIRDAGKVRARDRIAVLAALNLAFEVANAEASPEGVATEAAPTLTLDRRQDDKLLEPLIHRLDKVLARDGLLF